MFNRFERMARKADENKYRKKIGEGGGKAHAVNITKYFYSSKINGLMGG